MSEAKNKPTPKRRLTPKEVAQEAIEYIDNNMPYSDAVVAELAKKLEAATGKRESAKIEAAIGDVRPLFEQYERLFTGPRGVSADPQLTGIDLITGLLHLLHEAEVDVPPVLRWAYCHFMIEQGFESEDVFSRHDG